MSTFSSHEDDHLTESVLRLSPRERMLARASVGKLIWKLSFPAMAAMFVNGLYNLVDTIYIGHGVGRLGIGALSVSFPVQMIIIGMGAMLGIGTASVISRSLGAQNYERAGQAFGNSLSAIVLLSILFVIMGVGLLDYVLIAFGATEEILPYAREYMFIILLGSPLILGTISMNHVIRSEGAAKTAMWSMVIGALANIVLDPIFIFGLGLGMRGAALATITARVFSSAWIIFFFRSGRSSVPFTPKGMKPKADVLWEIVMIGFPSLLRLASSSIIFGMVNRLAALYGGNIAVAVFGINNRVIIFSAMPAIGIAQGMQPIVGYNYGAGKHHRALETIKISQIMALALCSAVTLILLLFAEPVLKIFSNDPELIEAGPKAMRLMVAAFFLAGFNKVGGAVFQALGKAGPAFVANVARPVLFFIPLLLTLPRLWKIDGVWLSFAAADILSFLLITALLIPQVKHLRSETPDNTVTSNGKKQSPDNAVTSNDRKQNPNYP